MLSSGCGFRSAEGAEPRCKVARNGGASDGTAASARIAPALAILVGLGGCGWIDSGVPDHISIPEGFEIELAAGPPLVERPMIVDADDQGRLYVAESSGSNDDVRKQLEERPHSILRLADTDGDGRYDERTVFADKMMFPEGVLWHEGSVYVAAPPSIWKLTDTDGDGVADEREEWFVKTLTNCANDLHGPYLGLDGRIYWTKGAFAEQVYERPGEEPFVTRAAHVFRRRATGGPIEHVLTGGMDNPVELAFTPEGERLLTSTFLQHPQLGRRDGLVHAVYGAVYGKQHGVTDDHPMTGGYMSVMTHMGGAAPVGLARYDSGVFGGGYRGSLFVTSFNLRKVSMHRLVASGATFTTEDTDFLVSTSRDFHPTDVMEDADGSLLVVDTGGWYKLCCPTAQLTKPDVLGAIYRIRRTGAVPPDDPWGTQLDWAGMGPAGWADMLDSERPAVRRRAIAVLARESAVEELSDVVRGSDSADARRNAVWGLTRIDEDAARAGVREALRDADAGVRQAALHSVALHRDAAAVQAVQDNLADASAAVRRVAAEALGRIRDRSAVPRLLAATAETDDEVLTHSLVYALIEIADAPSTRSGLAAADPRTRRAAMIALDQMRPAALTPDAILSRLSSTDPLISEAAEWIATRHPEWGGRLAGYLAGELARYRGEDPSDLAARINRFAGDPAVQDVLARTARGSQPRPVRELALESMAKALVEEPPEGWSSAIAAALGRRDTLAAALKAARNLPRPDAGDPVLDEALLQVARNKDFQSALRIQALDAAVLSQEVLVPGLFELATSQVLPTVAIDARAAAARVLARASLDEDQLASLAKLLGRLGPMELPLVVQAFQQSSDERIGGLLVARLAQAKGLSNLRADILKSVSASYPPSIRNELDRLLSGEVASLAEQADTLDEMLVSLERGDIRRGQVVFNSSETACLACHSIGYQGGDIGPDLTRIGQIRERRDLLEAIVFPSASFVRSYEPVVAVTANDSISGVPIEETDSHLLLAVSADEQVRVQRSDIEEVRPGTVSVMPSGLDEQLSRGQLADLLAFLEATQWGPPGSGH